MALAVLFGLAIVLCFVCVAVMVQGARQNRDNDESVALRGRASVEKSERDRAGTAPRLAGDDETRVSSWLDEHFFI